MKNIAIAYSPRGFANETRVIVAPSDQVAKIKSEINNNSNGYVLTGNAAARTKAQWKRDIMNGMEIETELNFF